MPEKKITKLDLHLKDYGAVRKDVDKLLSWLSLILKIIVGAVITALLALIGLK